MQQKERSLKYVFVGTEMSGVNTAFIGAVNFAKTPECYRSWPQSRLRQKGHGLLHWRELTEIADRM
jgi:hypothetical protein